jgi:hypothetical protein
MASMRVPIRSEREAFRLVAGTAAVVLAAALIGWLTEAVFGAAALGLALLVALIAYLRAGNPDRRPALREAATSPHPHGASAGNRHVLVIANEVLGGAELRARLDRATAGEQLEVDVLAPVLTSPLHYGVSDVDSGIAQARARLERSLAWMNELGIAARGEVGDPNPATAIEDELRDFGANEVIVVTHPRERQSRQERGELDRLQRELDVPVIQIAVDDHGDSGR